MTRLLSFSGLRGLRRLGVVLGLAASSLGFSAAAHAVPTLGASDAQVSYLAFAGDGDLSAFDAVVDSVLDVVASGSPRLSFGFGFSLANPSLGPSGGLTVFDDAGLLLGGDLASLTGAANSILFTLEGLNGRAAALFGARVLGEIVFSPFAGTDPFTALEDGEIYAVSVRLIGTPVALSAPQGAALVGLALLALGLGRTTTNARGRGRR